MKPVRATRRAAVRAIPDDFDVSSAIEEMCRTEKLPDPHVVLLHFRDDCLAKGRRYADWEAAFRNWMRSPITVERYPPWATSEAESQLRLEAQREAARATVTTPDLPRFTAEELARGNAETPSVELDNEGFDERIDAAFGAAQDAWK
jgi:hypothetical protein